MHIAKKGHKSIGLFIHSSHFTSGEGYSSFNNCFYSKTDKMNAYKQQRNLDILIKTCPGRNKNLHYDANKRYIFFFSSPISSPPLSFFLCFALLFLFCFVLLFFFLFSFLFFLSPSPLPFPSFYSSFPFSFPFPFPFSFPSLDPRQRRRARFRDWRVINFSVFHCSPELTL